MAKKLYGVSISGPVQRVLACLYEKEVDFEFVVVDMRAGEHKKEHFLTKNLLFVAFSRTLGADAAANCSMKLQELFSTQQPFGQIPVFEDGDITMFESRAITQYLAHGYADKGTGLIFPGDGKKMAALATWIEVESQKFDPQMSKLGFQLFYKPNFGMGPPDESVVAEIEAELSKVLDVYEAHLNHCKYLAGDEFSLPDLHHLPGLHIIMNSDSKKLVECRPNVHKWATDILARPSWSKVSEMQKSFSFFKLESKKS